MKGKLFNVALIFVFVAGLSLLLYPTISNYYNAYLQSQAIVDYSQQVDEMESEAYRQEWEKAEAYNQALLERSFPFSLPDELDEQYWDLLSTTAQGVMAYVEIPSIEVTLPIAHGTEERTLADFVGHLEWSSLPIGGESTHCVISGHRGLPSSKLFTNIDHLEPGDYFYLHVLGQTLEYQVDQIAVVEPDDFSLLGIEPGKDYTTLITCTPYGINSHRLLVRGIRRELTGTPGDGDLLVKNEATPVNITVLMLIAIVVISIMAFLLLLIFGSKKTPGQGGGKRVKE